ncbi:MAG: hypothetical protein GXP25_15075 [Planctomycetes bacterium]|nr:hypothetical protein [Planctomycetota bacterium]
MRYVRRSVIAFSLMLFVAGGAVGDPKTDTPKTLFEQFKKAPTAQAALQLARKGQTDPSRLRLGLMLPEPAPALLAWAMYQYPNPAVRRELEGLLKSADQVAGYWAAKTLGRIGDPASIPALAAQFPEKDREFWEISSGGRNRRGRMYYFRYIRKPGERARRVGVPAPSDMPNIRVAYAATEALGHIGGERAAQILMRELGRDHYLIRYGAVQALGKIRNEAARDKLKEMAQRDPVLIVRTAAQEAVARIDGTYRASASPPPELPPSIVFIKTKERTESNLAFRDAYPYPRVPWYAWGQNLYTLTPPQPDGELKNLTHLTDGGVQGAEVSYDGKRILFAMRKHFKTEGFHIYEINVDGTGLRQITSGNCNDIDPQYLPDGRIVFCSDRTGYHEFYHQERSRALYTMNADGSNIQQITFDPNSEFEPIVLPDGRILYGSYRFYGWDGGPTAVPQDPRKGISRIETVLHTILPDGTQDQMFYGSMRGGFYSTLRPMPYANQFQTTAWPRTDQMVGVGISFPRVLPDGRLVCVTPSGVAVVDPKKDPLDCEMPLYPEILNLAGGEEVYIHNFDDQNPIGRLTAPYPIGGDWIILSYAPWYDTRWNGYGLYLFNLKTREMRLVYDDPDMSDVDAIPIVPRPLPQVIRPRKVPADADTGFVYCQSVFNSDLPFDRSKIAFVRVLEAVQVGMSLNGNLGFQTRILGEAPISSDGSFYVELPADTPFRFALLDAERNVLVHETDFNYVRPNEQKGCIGCHERKGVGVVNAVPLAMHRPPYQAVRKRGDLVYGGRLSRSYTYIVRE